MSKQVNPESESFVVVDADGVDVMKFSGHRSPVTVPDEWGVEEVSPDELSNRDADFDRWRDWEDELTDG